MTKIEELLALAEEQDYNYAISVIVGSMRQGGKNVCFELGDLSGDSVYQGDMYHKGYTLHQIHKTTLERLLKEGFKLDEKDSRVRFQTKKKGEIGKTAVLTW